MILSYAVSALSVTCFVSFSWAIVRLFAAPTRVSRRMKILGVAGVVFSIAQIRVIALARQEGWRTGSALVLYVVALGLFWWAAPQAARAQLNIAFASVK